jgi:MFS family permease
VKHRNSLSADAVGHPESGGYRYWITFWLAVVYGLNFMDRQLLSILAQPIKQDLGLSDTQVGLLSGFMFAIFYSVLAIPVARLADRTNRVRIVSIGCGLWSLFTIGCGIATGFVTLALSRIGVAIGEAGGTPPSYSIIADYFRAHERATASALFSLGAPVGVMFGAFIGGWLAASYGWRAAFLALGMVGLVIAPLLPFVVREPERGRHDAQVPAAPDGRSETPSLTALIRLFLSSRLLLLTAVGSGLSSFTGYSLLMWLPAVLIRNMGMSLYEIALYYSLVSGGCLALGSWLGGVLIDRFGRTSPGAYGLIPALASLLAIPFVLLALAMPSWPTALTLFAVPLVLGIVYMPAAAAVVQNNLPADCRATGIAILLLWCNLLGLGCGPLCIGLLSDLLAPAYGTQSLVVALQWLIPVFLLSAACLFAAARAARPR